MSLFNDLFSLEGLVTFSLGSFLAVKNFHLNSTRIGNNVSIQGDSNIVLQSQQTKERSDGYRLLWYVLAVAVFIMYTFWAESLNAVLRISAPFAVFISLAGVAGAAKRFGTKGFFSLWYVPGGVVILWLVYRAEPFMAFTAQEAAKLSNDLRLLGAFVVTPLRYQETMFSRLALTAPLLREIIVTCFAIGGFTALFLAVCYVASAHKTERNFDEAVLFAKELTVTAICGTLLFCNVHTAVIVGDFPYVWRVLSSFITI